MLTRAVDVDAQGGAAGPLLVEDETATIYVPPEWHARKTQPAISSCEHRKAARMTLDPVDYAVISQALLAAAREMGTKLVRSAYSNIVREARDASAAILDPHGNIVAQSEMVPMQLGSMNTTLRACLALYPAATLTEDDFLVNNHPYHGGQHLQDVFIFRPVFVDGELIAFAGSTAHHLDLGGGSAGLNAMASDVYQEGLLLPPLKFSLSRDWNGGNFERLLAANIRVPDQTLGDFNAQFAAKAIGIERVRGLCAKYGVGRGEGDDGRADGLRRAAAARGDPRAAGRRLSRRRRRRRHRRQRLAVVGAREGDGRRRHDGDRPRRHVRAGRPQHQFADRVDANPR